MKSLILWVLIIFFCVSLFTLKSMAPSLAATDEFMPLKIGGLLFVALLVVAALRDLKFFD